MRLASESGQGAVENMVVISVIVVAVVAAGAAFVPMFQDGVDDLGGDVAAILESGRIGSGSAAPPSGLRPPPGGGGFPIPPPGSLGRPGCGSIPPGSGSGPSPRGDNPTIGPC